MKKILLMLLSLFVINTSLVANEKENLKVNFLNKIDEVIFIVKDKTIDKETRNGKIIDVLTPIFDFELMAKLSLGKKWRNLDKSSQDKFVTLYVKRMKQSYSSKLDAYSNEKVKVKSMKQPKSTRIYIDTDLVSSNDKLDIVYKFYKPKHKPSNKEDWLIYDVEILGVSILKTDRAQFNEFLKTKSLNQLMDELSKQI